MAFAFIAKIKNAVQATLATTKQKITNLKETFAKAVSRESKKPEKQAVRDFTLKEDKKEDKQPLDTFNDNFNDSFNDENEIITQYMRDAGDPILSPYDAGDVSAFFSLTAYIWNKPGINPSDRLKAIIDYFKAPLADIYNYIVKSEQMEDFLEAIYDGDDVNYLDLQFSPYTFMGYQVRG